MRRGTFILLMLLVFGVTFDGQEHRRGQLVQLPGSPNGARSPNGRYVLETSDFPSHELYLRDTRERSRRLLCRYDRHISVLWRDDSSAFVLNDFYASNQSNTYVYFVADLEHPVDIYKELRSKITAGRERETIFENDHVYMEGTRWLGLDRLKLDICGHGEIDRNGFDLSYQYTVRKGFRLLSRKTGGGC